MKLIPSKKNPFYKIYLSFFLFVVALIIGVVGYMLLQSYTFVEALYMTVIAMTTVGFGEVKPLDDVGRIFTIFLILSNIAIFTYFITQISTFFLDGEFQKYYKRVKMKKTIDHLEGHIIICGFGRNGMEAAKTFYKNNIDFVVIEQSHEAILDAGMKVDYFFQSDATRDEALLEAGIEHARALITTLPDDAANVFVVLTARSLNSKLKIISRASADTSIKKLKTAGADNVIMPDKIGGTHMASLVLSPDVKEFIDMLSTNVSNDFQIVELLVNKANLLKDIDCWHSTGATILGVKTANGEYKLNPAIDFKINESDRLIAMGSVKQLNELRNIIGE